MNGNDKHYPVSETYIFLLAGDNPFGGDLCDHRHRQFNTFAHIAADMQRLGYPAYFMPFLGIWKLLAAGALVVPVFRKLRQFAYMGMVIDLTGAIYSRVAIHDTAVSVFVPVLILLLVVSSWWQWSLRRRSPGG